MSSILIERKGLIWWILQPKDYMWLGCNETLLFWLQSCSTAAEHCNTELFRNHIFGYTRMFLKMPSASSFLFIHLSHPNVLLFFDSRYSTDTWNKAFPSCFCPVWQKLRLWFIDTVNLALRLLILDPKCHRQVVQSADSIQTDSHSSHLFEIFVIDYSRRFSAESGVVCTPTAAIKLA